MDSDPAVLARRRPGMTLPGMGRPTTLGMSAASLPDCRSCMARPFVAGRRRLSSPWVMGLVARRAASVLSYVVSLSSSLFIVVVVINSRPDVKPSIESMTAASLRTLTPQLTTPSSPLCAIPPIPTPPNLPQDSLPFPTSTRDPMFIVALSPSSRCVCVVVVVLPSIPRSPTDELENP